MAKVKRVNWKAAAAELAGRAIWALKYLDTKSGGGLVVNLRNGGASSIHRWEDWFMDSLDLVGYEIDRKAYYERKHNKGPRKAKKGK